MHFDYEKFGSGFLDMRLHRLRVLVTAQMDAYFEEIGIAAPSPCISVLLFLADRSSASAADIADALGYSHQLITQRIIQLDRLRCVRQFADQRDRRRKRIALTAKGKRQAGLLKQALPHAAAAFDALFDELNVELLTALKDAESALLDHPLADRLAALEAAGSSLRKRA